MSLWRWHSSNYQDDQQAWDRAAQFGDGHFTTMRIVNGNALWLDEHLKRLQHANQCLDIHFQTFVWDELLSTLKKAVCQCERGIIKVIVSSGADHGGYARTTSINGQWQILAKTIDLPTVQKPLTLIPAPFELANQPILAGLKTLNRLEQVLLAKAKQTLTDDYDFVVLDQYHQICETTAGNIFFCCEGQWHTPRLALAGVQGVARQVIMNQGWLGDVQTGDYTAADLSRAEQMFVCNSVRGAVAVQQVLGHPLTEVSVPKALAQLIEVSTN